MIDVMTVHQKEFCDKYNGSKDEELAMFKKWLSQDEVDVLTYMNFKTSKESWAPRLRGIRIGCTYPTVEEARKAGEESKKAFIKAAKDVELDSKALLIDGISYKQAQKYDKLKIEKFIHLGISMKNGSNDHRLADEFEDFIGDVTQDAKPYGRLLKLHKALLKLEDSGKIRDEDDIGYNSNVDIILETLQSEGFYGIALCVHTPQRHYSGGKSSYSFSWGSSYYQWVYGETFEEALEVGQKWADSMGKKDKAKAKVEAKAKTKAK